MDKARKIAQEELGRQQQQLIGLKSDPVPSLAAISECEERIASIQAKLDDPEKLRKWWDSVPEGIRETL